MKNINQKGLSSILFAMVFTIVLSLLAIGMATLARNDQRQVIDQNLGYQAQYAAESAVNQVQSQIATGSLSPSEKNNCSADTQYSVVNTNNAYVSCVQWTNKTPTVVLNGLDESPVSIPINTATGASPSAITFYWVSSEPSDTVYGGGSGLPNLDSTRIPVIKLAYVEAGGEGTFKQIYLVPRGVGSTSIGYGAISDGQVINAGCPSNECKLEITNPNIIGGYISISALGGTLERTVIELSGNEFEDVQYIIDATAVAEDVTKRVEARVGAGSSWRPGYAVAADRVCKDIKVDGTNGDSISGAAVCP